MTKYIEYGVSLNESQIKKIRNAVTATSIYLSKKNLQGDHKLPLTQSQVNKLNNTKTGVYLKLSAAQLKVIKTGGFLPLLTLIPLIAGAIGAAGGLTGGISAAVSAAKSNAEQQRHNKVIEEQLGTGIVSDTVSKVSVLGTFLGPLLKRIGLGLKDINEVTHGSCVCKKGLLMKKIGNGLYLEPEGSGVFLGQRGE